MGYFLLPIFVKPGNLRLLFWLGYRLYVAMVLYFVCLNNALINACTNTKQVSVATTVLLAQVLVLVLLNLQLARQLRRAGESTSKALFAPGKHPTRGKSKVKSQKYQTPSQLLKEAHFYWLW
ncbi:MAG: hypothetical protein ACREPR_17065 [Brasilonema sp.]